MRKILLAILFSVSAEAATTLCEVYGISDSPQSLKCVFGHGEVDLTCKDGQYLLDGETVEAAFHYEVEEGPVPLVFKTKKRELTVTLRSGRHHKATLSHNGNKVRGNCRL